jgi:hypothetical protein
VAIAGNLANCGMTPGEVQLLELHRKLFGVMDCVEVETDLCQRARMIPSAWLPLGPGPDPEIPNLDAPRSSTTVGPSEWAPSQAKAMQRHSSGAVSQGWLVSDP